MHFFEYGRLDKRVAKPENLQDACELCTSSPDQGYIIIAQ